MKINNIKKHTVITAFDTESKGADMLYGQEVLVTEGKIVLAKEIIKKGEFINGLLVSSKYGLGFVTNKCNESGTWLDIKGSDWLISCPTDTLKLVKPIIISETEKIESGDWVLGGPGDEAHNEIWQWDGDSYISDEDNKILALPEHFSPQQLQDIVDCKSKEGDKVLVECESKLIEPHKDQYGDLRKNKFESLIKLNSQYHITLHKVELCNKCRTSDIENCHSMYCPMRQTQTAEVLNKVEQKMYTREEMINHAFNFYYDMSVKMNVDFNKISKNRDNAKEWFDQYVK